MSKRAAALLVALLARASARECYATILYGAQPQPACAALVLGAALEALDPTRPRARGRRGHDAFAAAPRPKERPPARTCVGDAIASRRGPRRDRPGADTR